MKGTKTLVYPLNMANLTSNTTANLTSNTTAVSRIPATCDGDMVSRFIMSVIIELPIASIGILGNIMSFIVLCKQKHQLTTTKQLQGLAVVDTSVLLCVILLNSLRLLHVCVGGLHMYFSVYHYIFRWLYPTMYVLRQAQTWFITMLTMDRWTAVCQPLKAHKLRSLTMAYKQMVMIVILSLLVTTPRFLEIQIDHSSKFGFSLTAFSTNRMYTVIYKIVLFFLVMYLVPMVILIILNTQLIRTLRVAVVQRSEMQSWTDGQHRNSHRSVTIIVCAVVIICILSNTVAMIAHTLYSLAECFQSLAFLETWRRHVARVSNVLVTISSAINFFIYCLCSQNFRNVLLRTFRWRNVTHSFTGHGRHGTLNSNTGSTRLTSSTRRNSGTRLAYRFISTTGNVDKDGQDSCQL